jgi:hypothetical protein
MTVMWRRWNELSGPERYEFWAQAGLYVPFAVALLFDLTLARAQQVRVPGLVVFLLLAVGQAGACAVLLHASVSATWRGDQRRGDGWSPPPSR